MVSHSGLYNQHQGMDAIIEEVNKILKALIPPIPQQHHWIIAAHNCKKFFQVTFHIYIYRSYNFETYFVI